MTIRVGWRLRMCAVAALQVVGAAMAQRVAAQCDPVEVDQILPGDIEAADQFGYAVAMAGAYLMVGAAEDETENGIEVGTVRIFRRSGNQWAESQVLEGAHQWDHFGASIVMEGDWAVVGAPEFDITGVDQIGAIHIYERVGTQWVEDRMIVPLEAWDDYRFGTSVDLSGDDLIVGTGAGRAHIYRRSGSAWNEVSILEGEGELDDFGLSVAVAGDRALVGAPRDNQNAPVLGAVYAYERVAGLWELEEKILAEETIAFFGAAIDMEGEDLAVIGAPGENGFEGGAYIYRHRNSGWWQEKRLAVADSEGEAEFGASVALDGVLLVVGAHGDTSDPQFPGTARLYRFTGGSWLAQPALRPEEGESPEHFGWSVAIAGEQIVIGVSWDADLGGDPAPAYIFDANAGTRAAVESFIIKRGALVSGDVSRLRKSDDKRLSVESEFTPGGNPPYLMIMDVKLRTEVNNPSLLHVIVEGKLDQNDGEAKVFVYDWTLAKWKREARYGLGRQEKAKLVLDLDAGLYVRDDGLIKVRIRQEKVTSSNGNPFVSSTDQVEGLVR